MIDFELRNTARKYSCKFAIKSKITIIRGNSGTGKTSMLRFISASFSGSSAWIINCKLPCYVIENTNLDWDVAFRTRHNTIFMLDESFDYLVSEYFSKCVNESDNYFLIISRSPLKMLNYGIDSIYELTYSNRLWKLEKEYHLETDYQKPDLIITEVSGSGYQFFKAISEKESIDCISAIGKSEVANIAVNNKNRRILAVVDSMAFGCCIDRFRELFQKGHLRFFAPDSFEWLLLRSAMFGNDGIRIIENAKKLPMSNLNLEKVYEIRLSSLTAKLPCHYMKARLSSCYVENCCTVSSRACRYKVLGNKIQIILGMFWTRFWFSKS
jgi:hypothetical protein